MINWWGIQCLWSCLCVLCEVQNGRNGDAFNEKWPVCQRNLFLIYRLRNCLLHRMNKKRKAMNGARLCRAPLRVDAKREIEKQTRNSAQRVSVCVSERGRRERGQRNSANNNRNTPENLEFPASAGRAVNKGKAKTCKRWRRRGMERDERREWEANVRTTVRAPREIMNVIKKNARKFTKKAVGRRLPGREIFVDVVLLRIIKLPPMDAHWMNCDWSWREAERSAERARENAFRYYVVIRCCPALFNSAGRGAVRQYVLIAQRGLAYSETITTAHLNSSYVINFRVALASGPKCQRLECCVGEGTRWGQ